MSYSKKLKVYQKPAPTSNLTVLHARPSRLQSFAKKLFINALQNIKHGAIEIIMPDDERVLVGDPNEAPIEMKIFRYSFFVDVLYDSHVGLGESYTKGDWTSSDLTKVIRLLALNEQYIGSRISPIGTLGETFDLALHYLHRNTINKSRKNIRKHYDLSNEMFSLFLDSSMTYSSGVFDENHKTLHESQLNKIRSLIDKAQINSSHHILEVGSGWGALAIECVKRTGCRVTTVTLSEKQYDYARHRIIAEGLADKIDIRICDYRELEGTYDRIISCEMLEAVGKEFLGTFFSKCQSLLKPNGLAVIQVITMADKFYQVYSNGCDWIQKHIFPGAHLPSVGELSRVINKYTDFTIEDLENIGVHYARTLRIWRNNLEAKLGELHQLGFDDEFFRKWYYYFSYCEAGFDVRRINNIQLVISKTQNLFLADKRIANLPEIE